MAGDQPHDRLRARYIIELTRKSRSRSALFMLIICVVALGVVGVVLGRAAVSAPLRDNRRLSNTLLVLAIGCMVAVLVTYVAIVATETTEKNARQTTVARAAKPVVPAEQEVYAKAGSFTSSVVDLESVSPSLTELPADNGDMMITVQPGVLSKNANAIITLAGERQRTVITPP